MNLVRKSLPLQGSQNVLKVLPNVHIKHFSALNDEIRITISHPILREGQLKQEDPGIWQSPEFINYNQRTD